MAVTPQHGLLGRLLNYVVEQSKEIDPRAYTLAGASDFRRFPKDFAALPGVDLDLKLEGDHVWLQVQRLEARLAPRLGDAIQRDFISGSDDPSGAAPGERSRTQSPGSCRGFTRCPNVPPRRAVCAGLPSQKRCANCDHCGWPGQKGKSRAAGRSRSMATCSCSRSGWKPKKLRSHPNRCGASASRYSGGNSRGAGRVGMPRSITSTRRGRNSELIPKLAGSSPKKSRRTTASPSPCDAILWQRNKL